MYELIQAGSSSYYIDCPAKMGLYVVNGADAYLIDSGNDKSAGKKVRQILEKNRWELKAIFNTHSHADHIGGNKYLQEQTGCMVYAPGIEQSFTTYPVLESVCLYGGYSPKDLRHKFMMAQESDARCLTQDVLPEGLQMIPLPGHSFDMAGFRTEDGVVYLADCLSSKATLEKYQIGFLYDVAAYLDTLERVKEMQASLFVPAHADAAKEIAGLAQLNIDKVHEIEAQILELCQDPSSFETLLQKLFKIYGLAMTFEQYGLVGSTVRSYLSWLKDGGKLEVTFDDCVLKWRCIP